MLPPALRRACQLGGRLGGGRLLDRCRTAGTPLAAGCRHGLCPAGRSQHLAVHRGFATTVFSVKPGPGEPGGEQTLFVVGLNEGKFFGQDSAEEGLKLLERIAEHGGLSGPTYQLLLGLSERELKMIEDEHKVTKERLTPSRQLEGYRNCEVIPVIQASMVDKCHRRALGRAFNVTQAHVAWALWKHPREAVQLYWAYWRRKEHKNAACRHFWMKHLPVCGAVYFDGCAEIIAIRAAEMVAAGHLQRKGGTYVLVVNNMFFEPVAEHLKQLLDVAPKTLEGTDFSLQLQQRAIRLCDEYPDWTPVLLFVYLGIPVLFLQHALFGTQSLIGRIGIWEYFFPAGDNRE